jgi:hypothetical protein
LPTEVNNLLANGMNPNPVTKLFCFTHRFFFNKLPTDI